MTRELYKGYWIYIDQFEQVFVSRDGHLISRPRTLAEAKKQIDGLVAPLGETV